MVIANFHILKIFFCLTIEKSKLIISGIGKKKTTHKNIAYNCQKI